jgi:hypothetical protein
MNLILPWKRFQQENIQFMKTRKNMIMEDSLFIKLLYSDENLVMNSVYLEFPLVMQEINKNMVVFQQQENEALIQKMARIEQDILLYYKMVHQANKTMVLSVLSSLDRGFIKFNSLTGTSGPRIPFCKNDICVLKISGIWESTDAIGLNSKWYLIRGPHSAV